VAGNLGRELTILLPVAAAAAEPRAFPAWRPVAAVERWTDGEATFFGRLGRPFPTDLRPRGIAFPVPVVECAEPGATFAWGPRLEIAAVPPGAVPRPLSADLPLEREARRGSAEFGRISRETPLERVSRPIETARAQPAAVEPGSALAWGGRFEIAAAPAVRVPLAFPVLHAPAVIVPGEATFLGRAVRETPTARIAPASFFLPAPASPPSPAAAQFARTPLPPAAAPEARTPFAFSTVAPHILPIEGTATFLGRWTRETPTARIAPSLTVPAPATPPQPGSALFGRAPFETPAAPDVRVPVGWRIWMLLEPPAAPGSVSAWAPTRVAPLRPPFGFTLLSVPALALDRGVSIFRERPLEVPAPPPARAPRFWRVDLPEPEPATLE
jgi:hypothetical protein